MPKTVIRETRRDASGVFAMHSLMIATSVFAIIHMRISIEIEPQYLILRVTTACVAPQGDHLRCPID